MTRIVVNIPTGSVTSVEPTAEEIAENEANKLTPEYAAHEAQKQRETAQLQGVEMLGVMCSATKEDQNGLTAVAMGVTLARMSSSTFPGTVFQFSNGNQLTITDGNFNSIYAIWTPFRQSFFAVPA